MMVLAIASCSTIDCPLNNPVTTSVQAQRRCGQTARTRLPSPLHATSGVYGAAEQGNRHRQLPTARELRANPRTFFHFKMTTQQNKSFIDTLRITKEDHPHFSVG
ncbi:MAG: hypothetical protein ACLTGI_01465 [Hoylesella buccalis]